jgi:hypothetical protein
MTLIESSKDKKKCRVTFYIPLRNIFEKKLPISYLKSHLRSLDLLHLFINAQNFYEEKVERENFLNIESNVRDKMNSHEEKVILNPPQENNLINTQHNQTERKENDPSILKESEIKAAEKTESIIINGTDLNNYDLKLTESNLTENLEDKLTEIKYSTFNGTSDIITDVNEANSSNIDPVILKENELVKNLIQNKLNDLDVFLQRDWKLIEEKADYKISYIDEKMGFRSIKSEIFIDKNINIIWEYIIDLKNKKNYDKNFDSGHIIRQIDPNYRIVYLKFKGKLMISPRDITIAMHTRIVSFILIIL